MPSHIKADRHTIAVLLDDRSGPVRILQSGGADVHSGGAGLQCGFQRGVVAHATGHLDVHRATQLMHDGTQLITVVTGTEGGVQIDQMDPLRAGFDPRASGFQRGAVIGFRTGLTLAQTHGLAVTNVHRGQKSKRHDVLLI